ncbi:MAG TPA: hypothetical protein VFB66_05485 [Tepidisphaeraceae bacterium]|nr:hypothetical protein [Tepidisphaeraceae bacterium]
MSLESDCLLALTGLFPTQVELRDIEAARTLPETFAKRTRSWVTAKQGAFTYYKTPDTDKLFRDLAPPTQPEIAEWLRILVDFPEANEWIAGLQNARDYMRRLWPKNTFDTPAGPRTFPLSVDDAADMHSVFAVLDEPTRVLDELGSYTLTTQQALAFSECYPDLYQFTLASITEACGRKLAKDLPGATRERRMPWFPDGDKDLVMRVLELLPPEPLPQFAPPPPAKPADGNPVEQAVEGTATQGDLSGKPMTANK